MSETTNEVIDETPQYDSDSESTTESTSGDTISEPLVGDAAVDEETVVTEEQLPQEQPQETEKEETVKSDPPDDVCDIVAIPYINDGANNVQLFFNSMFRKTDNTPEGGAVYSAERYFFDKFANDDEPKWDGVFVCLYNFTKSGVVKDDRNVFLTKREFVSKWLWKKTGAREDVTFNVKCTMPKVWASHFQSFLKRMEEYGNIGHSGQLAFYSDGGGNYRPKFKFSTEFERVDGHPSSRINSKAEELFDAG